MSNLQIQVLLIIIGAVVGFILSQISMIIERYINRIGKLKVYYSFVPEIDGMGFDDKYWGFLTLNQKYTFDAPCILELQNTSNYTRVIRDLNLALYSGKQQIYKTIQLTEISSRKKEQLDVVNFGRDKGSYSFVIEPRSIQRQRVGFLLDVLENDLYEKNIDRIVLQYYDEKDKLKKCVVKEFCIGKDIITFEEDKDWILAKFK